MTVPFHFRIVLYYLLQSDHLVQIIISPVTAIHGGIRWINEGLLLVEDGCGVWKDIVWDTEE